MTNAGIFQHNEPHQRKVPKIQSGTVDRGLDRPFILSPFLEIAVGNSKFFSFLFCDLIWQYPRFGLTCDI